VKKIRLRSLRELLTRSYKNEELIPYFTWGPSETLAERYFQYARSFNASSFYLLVLVGTGLGAVFGSRASLIFLLALIIMGLALYFISRRIAEGIEIKRIAPAVAHEKSGIAITYECWNGANFPAFVVEAADNFTGYSNRRIDIGPFESIGSYSLEKMTVNVLCDGGMGVHTLGPLTLLVHDPLGIFQFVVTFDGTVEVKVLPMVSDVARIPVYAAIDSYQYGIYESHKRGTSVNFRGVREFTFGDSKKHVAWRASAKHCKMLVKDFERQVNSNVAIFLNMGAGMHIGDSKSSTWEKAKSICISVLMQQVKLRNSVSVYSQHFNTLEVYGEQSLASAIGQILPLEPHQKDDFFQSLQDFLKNLSPSSTAIIITPSIIRDLAMLPDALKSFKLRNVEVIFVLVNTHTFLASIFKRDPAANIFTLLPPEIFTAAHKRVVQSGACTYIVDEDASISRALSRPVSRI
jgi:uncharacterized protein (DUF58 family)